MKKAALSCFTGFLQKFSGVKWVKIAMIALAPNWCMEKSLTPTCGNQNLESYS